MLYEVITKKEEILTCINAYKDLLEFIEIVPVSALKGENQKELLDVLFRHLPEGPIRITSYNVCYTKLLRYILY